jgi:hypothetical protein
MLEPKNYLKNVKAKNSYNTIMKLSSENYSAFVSDEESPFRNNCHGITM